MGSAAVQTRTAGKCMPDTFDPPHQSRSLFTQLAVRVYINSLPVGMVDCSSGLGVLCQFVSLRTDGALSGDCAFSGDNAIDTDYVFIADEKSPMVCRHWKSKGWCKLEGKCKFLHPEHKRGTGPSPSAQRHANGTGVQRCISTGVSPTESTPSTASQQRGSKVSRCKSSGGGSHLIQTRGFQCGN